MRNSRLDWGPESTTKTCCRSGSTRMRFPCKLSQLPQRPWKAASDPNRLEHRPWLRAKPPLGDTQVFLRYVNPDCPATQLHSGEHCRACPCEGVQGDAAERTGNF